MECPGNDLGPQIKLRGISLRGWDETTRGQSVSRTRQEGTEFHTELSHIIMTTVVEYWNSLSQDPAPCHSFLYDLKNIWFFVIFLKGLMSPGLYIHKRQMESILFGDGDGDGSLLPSIATSPASLPSGRCPIPGSASFKTNHPSLLVFEGPTVNSVPESLFGANNFLDPDSFSPLF